MTDFSGPFLAKDTSEDFCCRVGAAGQKHGGGGSVLGSLPAFLEQLSVQAEGSRCRDASLRGSCATGSWLPFCALAGSGVHSLFLLPLRFLL